MELYLHSPKRFKDIVLQFTNFTSVFLLWRNVGIAPHILVSPLDRGQLSASRSDRFTPEEGASSTHWMGCGRSGRPVSAGNRIPVVQTVA
jgi:hypothetical protein